MSTTEVRKHGTLLAAGSAAALIPLAVLSMGTMRAAAVRDQAAQQGGTITIESWVYTALSENNLSATAWQCSKISGAISDQSGGPTWQDSAEYAAPTGLTGAAAIGAANKECADKVPSGGVVLVPPPEPGQYALGTYTATPGAASSGASTGLSTFYSHRRSRARRARYFSPLLRPTTSPAMTSTSMASKFPPGRTGPDTTIVITGGTGAYTNLQGSGTWKGDATMIPWCYRLATVKVWYSSPPDQAK